MKFAYLIASMAGIIGCLMALPVQAQHKKHHHPIHTATAKSQPLSHAPAATHAKPVAIATTYGAAQLTDQLNTIVNATSTNVNIAIYVKSMENGAPLYTRNINQALTPASILKVLTAEAALLYLKPDYRFSTQLLTDAKTVKGGVLQGNLYVVLSGDPTLTYDNLVELLLTLKSHQIQAIAGNVYIDNTAYDQSFYGPGWEEKDKQNCYAAPISASIINHNCMPIRVSVTNTPKPFNAAVKHSVATKSKQNRICTLRLSSTLNTGIEIEGCTSIGKNTGSISHVVTDVPEYNRSLFKNALNQLAVRVYGVVTFGSAPQNLSLVGSHVSAPLRDLIHHMLKKSDNIIAGAIFKKLGQLYSHQPGSWENGSVAVSQILATHAAVNVQGMRMLDGSGLSTANLTSPVQMMAVLDFAFHSKEIREDFISALPIAGVDGTLKHRMGNIAYKVRAKTGTMPLSGVVGLAGYAVSADREPLAFVIMVNGSSGMSWRYKSLEDQVATALTKYKRG